METKVDAIFEGGGVRGIGFVGAICCLEEKNYQWERLAGTSAGAIIAALLAVGYTGKELKTIMYQLNYNRFLDKKGIQRVPLLGKPLGLLIKKGMFAGSYMEEWLQELLKAKGKTKFKDVMVNGSSKLKIIASDITKRKIVILPDDLSEYVIDPMEFEISKAVRMSISIPLYFDPIKLQYEHGISYIVDGGVLSNFPVWIFDVDDTPRWPTFGFKLVDPGVSYTSQGKKDLLSFVLDIVDTMIDEDETVYMKSKDNIRTVSIPTLGVKTTEFDILKRDSKRLFESGYKSGNEFLKEWDFEDYIRKYRRFKNQY
jgi:NTE family protein